MGSRRYVRMDSRTPAALAWPSRKKKTKSVPKAAAQVEKIQQKRLKRPK